MRHKKRSSRQQGREDLSGLAAPLFQTAPAEFIRILGAADAAHPLHPADPALAVILVDQKREPEERTGFVGDPEPLQRQCGGIVLTDSEMKSGCLAKRIADFDFHQRAIPLDGTAHLTGLFRGNCRRAQQRQPPPIDHFH